MTELEKAARQALEALESTGLLLHHCWCDVQMNEHSFEKLNKQMEVVDSTITTLREALEKQPADEPVGKWMGDCIEWTENPYKFKKGQHIYTRPQPAAWVGLTDEEIHDIYDQVAKQEPYSGAVTRRNVARAIEAKLKEKNT